MSEAFFTPEELASLREITCDEIAELLDGIKSENGKTGAAMSKTRLLTIRRMFHTISGSAGIAGFESISELASKAEDFSETADPEDPKFEKRTAKYVKDIEKLLKKTSRKAGDAGV